MGASSLLAAILLAASPGFGAVTSSPLPQGSLSLWGMAGYPELRAGFRQGFKDMELQAEAGFDFLTATTRAEGGAQLLLLQGTQLKITGAALGGVFLNAGARLADDRNDHAAGLRLEVAANLSYQTDWPVCWLAFARLPVDLKLTSSGGNRGAPMIGGGAEVAVSKEQYILFVGGFGPDFRGNPSRTLLGVEAMVGFGYRVF